MLTIDKEKREKILGVARMIGGGVASVTVGLFVGAAGKVLLGNTSGLTKVGAGVGLWIAANALGNVGASYVEGGIDQAANAIDAGVMISNEVEKRMTTADEYTYEDEESGE